jgi:hypothetical protein
VNLAAVSSGAGIGLSYIDIAGTGRIALFLKDSANPGEQYALSCGHVLDDEPGADVFSSGCHIGHLAAIIRPCVGLPSYPSPGDAALVKLRRDLPLACDRIDEIIAPSAGKSLLIRNNSGTLRGTVERTGARLVIDYSRGPASFEDLITVAGVELGDGDSGSLCLTEDGRAAAMVIGASYQLAVLIGLQRTLDSLQELTGTTFVPL